MKYGKLMRHRPGGFVARADAGAEFVRAGTLFDDLTGQPRDALLRDVWAPSASMVTAVG